MRMTRDAPLIVWIVYTAVTFANVFFNKLLDEEGKRFLVFAWLFVLLTMACVLFAFVMFTLFITRVSSG